MHAMQCVQCNAMQCMHAMRATLNASVIWQKQKVRVLCLVEIYRTIALKSCTKMELLFVSAMCTRSNRSKDIFRGRYNSYPCCASLAYL
uniref:Uncharacterized protein n=1 Tax=Physcomitrium patens TaxID=3218 RepID=A0A2K1L9J7_PHYPA|nr:hypothetical protein PHYPA_001129 [Physcomitrium patens]